MKDFRSFDFACDGFPARRVFYKGCGPAVVLMHELPGLIPECTDLARQIAAAGFTVYVPLLFGEPDASLSVAKTIGFVAQLCISQEFYCFAKRRTSPITYWLRALCRKAHADSGGRGVGVIGMCLTGGFVLSLMADESVIAPVASQPSLPIGITKAHKAALGISDEDLAAAKVRASAGVPLLALRFTEDKTSPKERLDRLRQEFGGTPDIVRNDAVICWKRGESLETIEINSGLDNPFQISPMAHAVLTLGLRESGHPTREAFNRIMQFLQEQFEQ
ncbi:dienelactone hydrolase [filamentous cyanobacterium CCP5]|nr:dienelactone hydrolase [filamentous cyanobacterium CCP5]